MSTRTFLRVPVDSASAYPLVRLFQPWKAMPVPSIRPTTPSYVVTLSRFARSSNRKKGHLPVDAGAAQARATCVRRRPSLRNFGAVQDCTVAGLAELATGGEGSCARLPDHGEPCGLHFGVPRFCRPGLRCDGDQCRQIVSAGRICGSDEGCAEGRCVDGLCTLQCIDSEI